MPYEEKKRKSTVELECGHVVERWDIGKKKTNEFYCDQCKKKVLRKNYPYSKNQQVRVVGLGAPCPNCGIRMDLIKETKCSSDYSYEKCSKCGYTDKLLPMNEKEFTELLEKIEEQIASIHQFTGGQLDELMGQVRDKIKEVIKKDEQ